MATVIPVWKSHNPEYPTLIVGVVVTDRGHIVIPRSVEDMSVGSGRRLPLDQVDDMIAALQKAKAMAPRLAEAHECQVRAEAMLKQANADRLAAIQRAAEEL